MFGQRFFQEELPALLAAYRQERGDEKAQAELLLRHGVFIRIEGEVQARPEYMACDYKLRDEKRRALVPYDSIVAITFAPGEREKSKPGLI